MRIDGMPALVTGGASGLGAATARALARAGAKVAILDLNDDKGEAVAAEIGGRYFRCDVAEPDGAAAAIRLAEAAHGVARILVNCAGIGTAARGVGRDGPMPLETFERVIRVNLLGTFNMMRLAAAPMSIADALPEGGRGVIVSTASVAAFEGQIGQAAYAASKGGVHALTLPAARDLARHGIRVLAIAPGLFGTPMLLGMPQNVQDSLAATLPFPQRFGTPQEYADLVLFMIGSPVMNGETVRIDSAVRLAPQ